MYSVIKISKGNKSDLKNCQCFQEIGTTLYEYERVRDVNAAFKKASTYNDKRLICGCKVEVIEIKE